MTCPSTGAKMFCAGPNFLSQSTNLIATEIIFWCGTKCSPKHFDRHNIFWDLYKDKALIFISIYCNIIPKYRTKRHE
jgi:hypothetical protein